MGKKSSRQWLEIGEQVLMKPMRCQATQRKLSLKSRWSTGTWVGFARKTNEHIVISEDGKQAMSVRTVKRVVEEKRWDAKIVARIQSTPRVPNVRDLKQKAPRAERDTENMSLGGDGTKLEKPPSAVDSREELPRDFKITKGILDTYGFTDGCPACQLRGKGLPGHKSHSAECRSRLESLMIDDDVFKIRIEARDGRLAREVAKADQQSSGGRPMPVAEDIYVNGETHFTDSSPAHDPASSNADIQHRPRKRHDVEVCEDDTDHVARKRQRLEQDGVLERIEASFGISGVAQHKFLKVLQG